MPKPIIIFFLSCLVLQNNSYCQISWAYSPVFSFASLPTGIQQSRRDLGLGLGFDAYLYTGSYWRSGPGLALMATIPLDTGNSFVRVSPYSVYAEPRWTYWLLFQKNRFSVTPFLGIKSMLGAQIINRHVDKSQSSNTLLLLALGPRIGIAYWLSNFGLACSYDISFGTIKLRQELNLSLIWHNI
jgi:hypothetical protein